jgi:hypothetical protein
MLGRKALIRSELEVERDAIIRVTSDNVVQLLVLRVVEDSAIRPRNSQFGARPYSKKP